VPTRRVLMYRFAAILAVVAAAVLSVADMIGGGH
jgi:hypothetical protein